MQLLISGAFFLVTPNGCGLTLQSFGMDSLEHDDGGQGAILGSCVDSYDGVIACN